jgi:hypothetical protein
VQTVKMLSFTEPSSLFAIIDEVIEYSGALDAEAARRSCHSGAALGSAPFLVRLRHFPRPA